MRRIAVSNQKGGSAKTTTAVNLAAALAENGRKVLVLDLDPQGSSSSWLGMAGRPSGAYELLAESGPAVDLVQTTAFNDIAVIPATPALHNAERTLAREIGAEMVLQRRLAGLGGNWDYLLIDTPPTLGMLTLNALAAADELIAPVEAHVMALAGVAQLMETMRMVRERLNPGLRLAGILACRVDSRTRHSLDVVASMRKTFGSDVYNTVIRENVRLAEAPSFHMPITRYDSQSAGAADYRAAAAEVMAQEGSAR
ncbi:ParA family protein [Ferrovibrio sp.]|uniref:ParA family protein n=1 Tax=Ferrovibrio sp. TaxID=1917215 RepID=UPI001B3EE034|nr:ParA family protein [Ferrovibrio sp.]MBP7063493.1 ParA family protein [Ferrovibrio sp.]